MTNEEKVLAKIKSEITLATITIKQNEIKLETLKKLLESIEKENNFSIQQEKNKLK